MKMLYEQYLYKIYILWNMLNNNLLENQGHKSKQVVFQIWGWYLKNELSVKFCLGAVPHFPH